MTSNTCRGLWWASTSMSRVRTTTSSRVVSGNFGRFLALSELLKITIGTLVALCG
jgi:hypothetical protein